MKKLLLALLAVGTFTAANAQKNSILAFGTLGLNVDNNSNNDGDNTESETIGFNIAPGVGYQFTKHWTVGLQGSFNRNSINNSRTERVFNGEDSINILFSLDDVTQSWSVGPFVRYTHNFNNTFSVFGQLQGGYVSGYSATDIDSGFNAAFVPVVGRVTDEFSGFNIGFFPALAINVHEGLALNFGFGGINYQSINFESGVSNLLDASASNFAVTFGQQFNVGISKNFGCKKKHRGHAEPGSDLRRSNDAYDDEDESPKKKKAAQSDDDDE